MEGTTTTAALVFREQQNPGSAVPPNLSTGAKQYRASALAEIWTSVYVQRLKLQF